MDGHTCVAVHGDLGFLGSSDLTEQAITQYSLEVDARVSFLKEH